MLARIQSILTFIFILSATTAQLVVPLQEPIPMDQSSATTSSLTIADLLPRIQRIQIFGSLLRDVDDAWERLSNEKTPSIVLAPENSALNNLPQKPWKQAADVKAFGEQAYEGEAGMQMAQGNMKKFVEGYIVPVASWTEGQKARTLGGKEVWWESNGSEKVIQPGDIQVENVADKAGNGEVWIIKGLLNGT